MDKAWEKGRLIVEGGEAAGCWVWLVPQGGGAVPGGFGAFGEIRAPAAAPVP